MIWKVRLIVSLPLLVIYLFVWPFNFWPSHKHKAPIPAPTTPVITRDLRVLPELPDSIKDACVTLDDGRVFYYGPDGAVGVGDSCVGALLNWNRAEPPKPLLKG